MSHLHHKVSALIDGELGPGARARALTHARGCADCRREIAETLEVKRRVNRLSPVEVSADLLDVVGSITAPRAGASAAASPNPRPPLLRRVLTGAGSLSAVVITLAYVVGAPQTSTAEPVSPSVEEFAAEFADGSALAPLSDPAVGALDTDRGFADVVTTTYSDHFSARSSTPAAIGAIGAPLPIARSGDDRRAVHQLDRALEAPARFGYVGVLVITSYLRGRVQTFNVEVRHAAGQGTRFGVMRSDGQVAAESFVTEPSGPGRQHGLDALDATYDLTVDGREEVDGRPTTVVSASEQGELTARFWIDAETGLLLRRELFADGRLVRSSAFTSFTLNRNGFMPHLPPEVSAPPTKLLSKDVAPALNDKGWACPEWLNGRFHLSSLHQVDADGGVMRAEYTDGLSRIAVFEERGSLDPSTLRDFVAVTVGGHRVYVKPGLPVVAVWESEGTVFTVVTDAPQQLVGHLISRLPHVEDPQSPGVTSRIEHGLSKMVSAVAP